MSLLAQEQLFLAMSLPRGDRSAVQVNGNGFTRRQASLNGFFVDRNRGTRDRGAQPDSSWFLGAFHGEWGQEKDEVVSREKVLRSWRGERDLSPTLWPLDRELFYTTIFILDFFKKKK